MNTDKYSLWYRLSDRWRLLSGVGLGIVLALTLTQISATMTPRSCIQANGAYEENCTVVAGFSAVSLPVSDLPVTGGGCLPPNFDNPISHNNLYEPNGDRTTATPIISGIAQTHSISPANDEDWLTFTLTESSPVVIETNGDSGGDTVLTLYDAELNEIADNDDIDYPTNAFSSISQCGENRLNGGRYYIKVISYNQNEIIDDYKVSVVMGEAEGAGVTSVRSPAFGSLLFADYVALKDEARTLLDNGIAHRKTMEPAHEPLTFHQQRNTLLTDAGRLRASELQQLQAVEADLVQARDIYALLATHFPSNDRRNRFFTKPICDSDDEERPFWTPPSDATPLDQLNSLKNWEPEINECDFQARLREAVREAATMRLIVSQAIVIDAVDTPFSAALAGTDQLIREEMTQLNEATIHLNQAHTVLMSALDREVGNGCLVSDYFTQQEWGLLARIGEQAATIQNQIASRQLFLGGGVDSVAAGQAQAEENKANTIALHKENMQVQYVELIGLAGLAETPSRCETVANQDGTVGPPQSQYVARTVLERERSKAEMIRLESGVTMFGFSPDLTPMESRFNAASGEWFKLSGTLFGNANEEIETLTEWQRTQRDQWMRAMNAQLYLFDEVKDIEDRAEATILPTTGCTVENEDWQECVDREVGKITTCMDILDEGIVNGALPIIPRSGDAYDVLVNVTSTEDGTDVENLNFSGMFENQTPKKIDDTFITNFNNCVVGQDSNGNPIAGARIAGPETRKILQDVGNAYGDWSNKTNEMLALNYEIQVSDSANAKISGALEDKRIANSVAAAAQAAADAAVCAEDENAFSLALGGGISTGACVVAQVLNGVAQTGAAVVDGDTDIEISDQEVRKEVAGQLTALWAFNDEVGAFKSEQAFARAELNDVLDGIERYVERTNTSVDRFDLHPANDPSFALMRDSQTVLAAEQMEVARLSVYTAARHLEYRYGVSLWEEGVRFTDIYRARTGEDLALVATAIRNVATDLEVDNTILPLSMISQGATGEALVDEKTITISLAHDYLFPDQFIRIDPRFSTATESQLEARRLELFQSWVLRNTVTNQFGEQELQFTVDTAKEDAKLFNDNYRNWRRMYRAAFSGSGLMLNVKTDVPTTSDDISQVAVTTTQSNEVTLRTSRGCFFDYKLMLASDIEKGVAFGASDKTENNQQTATYEANVNGSTVDNPAGLKSSKFFARPILSNYTINIADVSGEVDGTLDFATVTDIDLIFKVFANTTNEAIPDPDLANCVRVDW